MFSIDDLGKKEHEPVVEWGNSTVNRMNQMQGCVLYHRKAGRKDPAGFRLFCEFLELCAVQLVVGCYEGCQFLCDDLHSANVITFDV